MVMAACVPTLDGHPCPAEQLIGDLVAREQILWGVEGFPVVMRSAG